jgi:MFS family permease
MYGQTPEDVPGTILIWDNHNSPDGIQHANDGHIVLQPQPSEDPEDPLNWAKSRKTRSIIMSYIYTFGIGIATTVTYSILTQIADAQGLTIANLNTGTGIMQIMQGWGCLLWQPIAMTYGRRGVYIVTIALSTIPVLWTPFSNGASQWYAHRILLGIFCCPVESLPEVSVPDVYFAHERGRYIALYAFILFGSNFLAPFLAGFIADQQGWKPVMYFATAVMATCTIILFFGLEETMFFRKTTEGTAPAALPAKEIDEQHVDNKNTAEDQRRQSLANTTHTTSIHHRPARTYLQKLQLWTFLPGRPTKQQMFLKSWRSLKIIVLFPNILWVGLLFGTNIGWYSVMNATMSLILSAAPYNFSPRMIGVAYLSPLVGGGVACVWAGKVSDMLVLYLAKRNKGIREPEQRLWGLALSAIMSTCGLLMWGVGASQSAHYMVLIIGIGVMTFGVVSACAISLAYSVDCFKEIHGESFVSIMVIRNTIGFCFSYAITPWIESVGLRNCFISVSIISFVCTNSFLLMVFFGKSLRRACAERYWRYVAAEKDTAIY